MKKIVLLLMIVNSFVYARDFEYISFFQNNIPRSENYLLEAQGKSKEFLDRYYCTQMSDQLFGLDLKENLNEDSLKIEDKKGHVVIFKENMNSNNQFIRKTLSALEKIIATEEGRQLVKKLMRSPYSLTIKSGGNRFDPRGIHSRPMFSINEAGALTTFITKRLQVERLPFKNWGTGGIVFWDSVKEYSAMESDDNIRGTPTFIALAHELYHAYDSIRGLLDRRMIKGESYEFQPVIEYRAVYFENIMRKHYGRLYRKYYSAPSKNVVGSMLDDLGNPRWIESDCLL